MPNPSLQKIIKLTQTQYDILAAGGTVGAYTGLNDNYLYLIQDDKDYLPYAYWSSDHGVDNLPFGVTSSQATQTGQYGNNHSVFMYFNQVGTPFQLQIPDSSESYIYKRYYSGGSWSAWSKVSAGFADSAGDADTVDGRDADEFYLATNPEGYTSNQGTVTSVGAGTGLLISGTSTVNPTVNIASGYKLPTTTEWDNLATQYYVDQEVASCQEWVGENYLGLHAKADDSDLLDGHDSSYFATASSLSGYVPFDATTARATVDGTNASPHFYNLENNTLISGYGDYWYVLNMGHYSGNNYASQIAMNYQDSISDTDMFIRTANNNTWRSWRRVLTDNNYSSYALPLSGGTVTGDVTVTRNSDPVTFTIGGNYSKGTLRIWDGADGDYIDLKADTTFNRQTLYIPNEGDEHTIATREWVTESYWADVNISASSNKGTTPTFSTVTIGGSGSIEGKATMQYNSTEDCIDFVFA